MKQLRLFLNSPLKRNNLKRIIKPEYGVSRSNLKKRISRFPLTVNQISYPCRKWFIGNGSFQEAIGSILVLAQCFGMMPVVGVKSASASALEFKCTSFRTIYSIIAFVLISVDAGMIFWITLNNEIRFEGISPAVFFGSVVYGMFCFGVLAKKWPMIMRHWESVEAIMPRYRTQREKRKLAHQLKMLAIVMLTGALVENLLDSITAIHYVKICRDQENTIEEFFKMYFSQFFHFVPYSPWIAYVGKLSNIIATFCWNYMNLFIMMISIGLSSRFKQINEDLQKIKGEYMSEDFWALRRTQYRKLCGLCGMVDDAVSQITFLSLSNNLFFIAMQLLQSMRPMGNISRAVYFWYSLAFLISRTLAVSLYTSQIYEESKKPVRVLRAVPNWSAEVQRFTEHVVNDTVALTGMRFFYLTRKLILTVVGTIITYELVLIQFYTEDTSPMTCANIS